MITITKHSAFGEATRLNQPESIVSKIQLQYDYKYKTLASQKAIKLNQLESTFTEP